MSRAKLELTMYNEIRTRHETVRIDYAAKDRSKIKRERRYFAAKVKVRRETLGLDKLDDRDQIERVQPAPKQTVCVMVDWVSVTEIVPCRPQIYVRRAA